MDFDLDAHLAAIAADQGRRTPGRDLVVLAVTGAAVTTGVLVGAGLRAGAALVRAVCRG